MESMVSAAKDDWESLMKSYLRKLFGLFRLESLHAPPEIIEMRRKPIRDAWERLVHAVRKDFQGKLIDTKTREWLELKFKGYAGEIVFEALSIKASSTIRPCESCKHFKDVESDDEITDVSIDPTIRTGDVIRDRCRSEPQLYPIHVQTGRFNIIVDGCKVFEPLHGDMTAEEIKNQGQQALAQDTQEFETWIDQLKFGESLLD